MSRFGYTMPDVRAMEQELRDAQVGHDPRPTPKRTALGPTRTTSCPYTETAQRKPYVPVEDTSTPSLDDGVSYRQKL